MLTPSSISKMIWGSYAKATFDNIEGAFSDAAFEDNLFYALIGVEPIRVAGLSGEGGFFASLLIMSWIICHHYGGSRLQLAILTVGLALSLSKVTVMILPLLLIMALKKYIRKIPLVGVLLALGCVLNIAGAYAIEELYLSETFMHRFAGYYAVNFMDLETMLLGVPKGTELSYQLFSGLSNMLFFPYKFNSFCGYPDFIQHIGYIGLFCWIAAVKSIRLNSWGFLFIVMATININLETATTASILAWFIACDFKLAPLDDKGRYASSYSN